MFKDQFTLKKSSYPAKLMKYIWGLNPQDFSHMCPYFWLSLFNHFAILVVFPIKGTIQLLSYLIPMIGKGIWLLIKPINDSINKKLEENNRKREIRLQAKRNEKWAREKAEWEAKKNFYLANPEELAKMKEKKPNVFDKILDNIRQYHRDDWYKLRDQVESVEDKLKRQQWAIEAEEAAKKVQEAMNRKKQQFLDFYKGDDTEALLNDGSFENVLRKWEQEMTQRQIEAAAAKLRERKARINKILKVTKPITAFLAYTLGGAVVLAGLYYGWKFVVWCAEGFQSVPHQNYVFVGNVFGIIILCVAGTAILVFGGIYIRKWILSLPAIKLPKWMKFKRKRSSFQETVMYSTYNEQTNLISDYQRRKLRKEKMRKLLSPISKFLNMFVFIWGNVICKIGKSIKNAFFFVIQMLKNNCPAIKWED